MVTETEKSLKILAETEMRPILGISDDGSSNGEDLGKEEGEMNLYRSGSAPPTVEGSLTAVGGLFSHGGDSSASASVSEAEEELRSDPSYLSYYYSNVNLNPRLPPPLLSKEDWRSARRSSVLGGIGDRRNVNQVDEMGSRSLFSLQPGFNSHLEESEIDSRKQQVLAEWGSDGLIGLPDLGLGSRRNSFADNFQDDLGRATLVSGHPSRPVSCISFNSGVDTLGPAEAKLTQLQHELTSADSLRSANVQGISMVPNIGASTSHTFASALGSSLSRSTTPDPQLIVRVPSPYLPPVGGGRFGASDKRSINGPNSFSGIPSTMSESVDLITAFSGINLSTNNVVDNENHLPLQIRQEIDDHQNFPFNMQGDLEQVELHNSYLKGPSPPNLSSVGGLPPTYHNVDGTNSEFANYGLSGHSINPALLSMMANQVGSSNIPPLFENVAAASAMAASGMDLRAFGGGLPSGPNISAAELHNLNRMGNHMAGSALQVPPVEPMYLQYLRTEYAAAQLAALNDPSIDRNYMGNSYVDLLGLQKAYLESLVSAQKSQYGDPFVGKSGGLNNSYYGNPTFGGLGMYPGSPLASPVVPNSPVGSCSPLRRSERDMQFTSGMRNLAGGVMGSWHLDSGANLDESFASSLLEEFKSNKTRSFELSVIEGHVVEFSADQYGSRFIQQKLETATAEEKNMVYQEIMPQAFSLMTDVFGNYVIQKFFEHGTTFQRRELANQLNGHVLTLSLQMYGCRVIQKAIEVVDLDQQTNMVAELDGHVMRCVRDQNGNHVIQKCIECVPQDAIQFIITSFYDQVVALSTHPYGCRVIQRVLEHCNDPTTQRIMMDEILQYICMLAQDQYGNYVVQHVLEHGKPHERSAIIKKLAGQIVQMSQQKFASNVVEKCLTFGGPEERQILVNEMLGTTDENEPLQAMMKDQFANYVVQKVLETCDDQQRELILSRIKVHLSALKKYTYGKHIVARVEKLVAAGERRIGPRYTYPDLIA